MQHCNLDLMYSLRIELVINLPEFSSVFKYDGYITRIEVLILSLS